MCSTSNCSYYHYAQGTDLTLEVVRWESPITVLTFAPRKWTGSMPLKILHCATNLHPLPLVGDPPPLHFFHSDKNILWSIAIASKTFSTIIAPDIQQYTSLLLGDPAKECLKVNATTQNSSYQNPSTRFGTLRFDSEETANKTFMSSFKQHADDAFQSSDAYDSTAKVSFVNNNSHRMQILTVFF